MVDEIYMRTLAEVATTWQLKDGIKRYHALSEHKLYQKAIDWDESVSSRFVKQVQVLKDTDSELKKTKVALKDARGKLELENSQTTPLMPKVLHALERIVKRFTDSQQSVSSDESRLKVSQLQTRSAELENERDMLKEKMRRLELEFFSEFFEHLPPVISAPKDPNVFGISPEGFEGSRKAFLFFGEHAKYMININLRPYLEILDTSVILEVLQEELDAYNSDIQSHFEESFKESTALNQIPFQLIMDFLWDRVDSTEELVQLLERNPRLETLYRSASLNYNNLNQTNFEVFYKRMNEFLRRLLPLPSGVGEEMLICLEKDEELKDHFSKGLFGILEQYFQKKNIIFDVNIDEAFAIGDYVSIRIGNIIKKEYMKDSLLGVDISYTLIKVRIVGGCSFIRKSYYNNAQNFIFLEDQTSAPLTDGEAEPESPYSALQRESDVLLHEKAHVLFEQIVGTRELTPVKRHIQSELFARLVETAFGECPGNSINEIKNMQYGNMIYRGTFEQMKQFIDFRRIFLQPAKEKTPTIEELSPKEVASADYQAERFAHIKTAFRRALERYLKWLIDEQIGNLQIIYRILANIRMAQ